MQIDHQCVDAADIASPSFGLAAVVPPDGFGPASVRGAELDQIGGAGGDIAPRLEGLDGRGEAVAVPAQIDLHGTDIDVVLAVNRDRLVAGDVAARFLQAVLRGARVRRLLSDEHFSVDGTLIEAWASMKSFRRKDDGGDPPAGRNAERDFRGERRSNATHSSSTDADARLFRKGEGQSSRLCYMGHLLMENRNALIVDAALTRAGGTAEREAALAMLGRRKTARRVTLGADKAYDVAGFVDALRDLAVTPHIAIDGHVRKTGKPRATRIDRRTTRHPGYAASQRLRKRIEEGFGWIKTTGGLAKTRHRGLDRVGWMFTFTAAAYNLVRLPKLLAEAPT